jgi:hypothetical protein
VNERIRSIFEQTALATGKVARVTGKVALWTVAAGAGLWLLGKVAETEAEEEAKKPPVVVRFDGQNDTYTAPFTTNGPWQILWEGSLDIEIWLQDQARTPVLYDRASGNGASAFFPLAGMFYLVVRRLDPGWWSITVRSR